MHESWIPTRNPDSETKWETMFWRHGTSNPGCSGIEGSEEEVWHWHQKGPKYLLQLLWVLHFLQQEADRSTWWAAPSVENKASWGRLWGSALRSPQECWQIFSTLVSPKPWWLFVSRHPLLSWSPKCQLWKAWMIIIQWLSPYCHELLWTASFGAHWKQNQYQLQPPISTLTGRTGLCLTQCQLSSSLLSPIWRTRTHMSDCFSWTLVLPSIPSSHRL